MCFQGLKFQPGLCQESEALRFGAFHRLSVSSNPAEPGVKKGVGLKISPKPYAETSFLTPV